MGLITANNIMREVSRLQDELDQEQEKIENYNAHYISYLQININALKCEAYYEYN